MEKGYKRKIQRKTPQPRAAREKKIPHPGIERAGNAGRLAPKRATERKKDMSGPNENASQQGQPSKLKRDNDGKWALKITNRRGKQGKLLGVKPRMAELQKGRGST